MDQPELYTYLIIFDVTITFFRGKICMWSQTCVGNTIMSLCGDFSVVSLIQCVEVRFCCSSF